jgi:hypothetical protein
MKKIIQLPYKGKISTLPVPPSQLPISLFSRARKAPPSRPNDLPSNNTLPRLLQLLHDPHQLRHMSIPLIIIGRPIKLKAQILGQVLFQDSHVVLWVLVALQYLFDVVVEWTVLVLVLAGGGKWWGGGDFGGA